MSTTTSFPSPAIPPMPVHRLSVDQYHRMIETGILKPEDRIELLEGYLVPKMPRNPPHDAVISLILNRVLAPRLPGGLFARGQSAITTAYSEPEPDVAIVRGSERDYFARHPRPADMPLVIEVSDSSLASDRAVKGRIYAAASIPVYWIVNLVDHQVEVYSDPIGSAYGTRRDYSAFDDMPLLIDGADLGPIAARDLLP